MWILFMEKATNCGLERESTFSTTYGCTHKKVLKIHIYVQNYVSLWCQNVKYLRFLYINYKAYPTFKFDKTQWGFLLKLWVRLCYKKKLVLFHTRWTFSKIITIKYILNKCPKADKSFIKWDAIIMTCNELISKILKQKVFSKSELDFNKKKLRINQLNV